MRSTGRRARCVTAYSTDHEPDGTLLKCCGNRREAVCPSCARTYRGDAFQLVAAGMRGGKGVPETVAEHPLVFLTLTAPSFGPVHSRRVVDGKARRCRPRRGGEVCPHGVSLACTEVHDEDDPRLGEPICAECFDYEHAVLWNALAPELWRLHVEPVPARAGAAARRQSRCELDVRVSYIKVAEFQRRGALHFHCVLRLDGVGEDGELEAPAARVRVPAADRRGVRSRAARVRALPRSAERRAGSLASRTGRRARSAGARRSRSASSTRTGRRRSGVVRGLHREVRDQVDRGGRRADVPPGGDRRPAAARAPARPALDRVRLAARRLPAPARPAAAAVGAPARVPWALLHEEPALLDDVHGAAPGAPRARAAAPARQRAA